MHITDFKLMPNGPRSSVTKAMWSRTKACIQLLLAHRADPSITDNKGRDALAELGENGARDYPVQFAELVSLLEAN